MNLYKIWQEVNNGYDTFDEAVVCAENQEEAIKFHPDGEYNYKEEDIENKKAWGVSPNTNADRSWGSWAKKKDVQVKKIGVADDTLVQGVIVASFHAG